MLPVALAVLALAASPPSGERAHDTVRAIAALGARPAGSPVERRAAALVAVRFRALGYRVVIQRVPLPRGGSSRNVVAVPKGLIRAVVVAHLDGVSEGPAANDNASGVAVMLELARVLRERDGILFAALGAEERVETGSRIHLGSARLARGFSAAGKRRIRLAVSLDMVGVGARLYVRGIEPRPNRSARLFRLPYLRDSGHSDHVELSRAGLPAAWLQWRDDACWHRACDRAERVDPAKLERVARLVLRALESA